VPTEHKGENAPNHFCHLVEKGGENAQTRNYQENREIRQLVLTLLQISHGQSISFDIFIGENINLVYEVVRMCTLVINLQIVNSGS
jgi:hypothetical protein